MSEAPVQTVNHFAAQLGPTLDGSKPDELFLTFGHGVPPFQMGQEDGAAVLDMPVHTVAKYTLTKDRLDGLIRVLTEAAGQWDGQEARSGASD